MDNTQDTTIRPWGFFTNLFRKDKYLVKVIHVNPGQRLSVQSHNHRSEHWFVTEGIATVILDKKEFTLKTGDSLDIPVKSIHSLQNNTQEAVEVIEIQHGEILSEDDIIRYSDIYGRA